MMPIAGSKYAGSSPRTWGTLLASLADSIHTRFIPTYMGNTVTYG